jgi:hypothetical protein
LSFRAGGVSGGDRGNVQIHCDHEFRQHRLWSSTRVQMCRSRTVQKTWLVFSGVPSPSEEKRRNTNKRSGFTSTMRMRVTFVTELPVWRPIPASPSDSHPLSTGLETHGPQANLGFRLQSATGQDYICDAPLERPHLCRQFHASYPNGRARTAVGRRSDEFGCCAWIGSG